MQIMCICNVMSTACSTRRWSVRMFSRRCSSKRRCRRMCVHHSLFTLVGLTRQRFRPLAKPLSNLATGVGRRAKKSTRPRSSLCSPRVPLTVRSSLPDRCFFAFIISPRELASSLSDLKSLRAASGPHVKIIPNGCYLGNCC